jgi:predicted dithiol-disulfide oxidoreductase (DUF899 family)/uncharacterized protein YndB with AHSA1/START domain
VTVTEINAVATAIRIAATPETVFDYLVEPDKMRRWMGTRVDLSPKPQGLYAVDVNAEARARGTFLEIDRPSRVVFSFGWEGDPATPPGSTTVEITLTPDGDGTLVQLVHRGMSLAETREAHRHGWEHYLTRLGVAASGGDPGPDPNANPPLRQTRLPNEPADYLAAREQLRQAEVELMQHVERVAEMRRALPTGAEVQDYVFSEGPADLDAGDVPSQVRLSELFSQPGRPLIVYQLMYGKLQTEPCPMCTMWIDGYNGVARHLARKVDFAIAAAADLPALRAYARSRGWTNLRLLSCGDSTFKYDLGSEDAAGEQDSSIAVFTRDADGSLHHFYTAHPRMSHDIDQRGIDALTPVWNLFDLTPAGRPDWYPDLTY